MNIFLNRDIARLILLQRIELSTPFLKKIRKLSGRYFFTNVASKYFISPKKIGEKYLEIMQKEYDDLAKFVNFDDKKILSIGGGICGFELLTILNHQKTHISIIERNFLSNKVVYGWDKENSEAYNDLNLVKLFFIKNGINENFFSIYDFDNEKLPEKHFDIIISLYSMDYHYDFNLYQSYFKKIFKKETKLIFDTIRPDYFKKMFNNVDIISSVQNTVHKSNRIICSEPKF